MQQEDSRENSRIDFYADGSHEEQQLTSIFMGNDEPVEASNPSFETIQLHE